MIDFRIIKNLEVLGDRYCRHHLDIWRADIAENWWTAFRFFFSHAFMRGRRDRLSEEYFSFTMHTLKEYFHIQEKPTDKDFIKLSCHLGDFIEDFDDIMDFKERPGRKRTDNSIKDKSFYNDIVVSHPLVNKLVAKSNIKGQRPLNNDKDLLMVLSSLSFLTRKGMPANVHNYIVYQLNLGNANGIAKAIKDIYAIGDKLSAFILRDIVLLNPSIRVQNLSLAFPIDTWVLKIAKKLGCKSEDPQEVKGYFIDQLEGMSFAKVAAGLWYLGFNALDILCINLDKIDLTSWE